MSEKTSRRQFLKTSSVLTASTTLVGGLTISQSAHAQGSDQIKIAMIGCGGRNNGAIQDRAQVGDHFKVVAIADAFEARAKGTATSLRNDAGNAEHALHGKVDLPDDRVFWGLDSYKKAIACLNPGDQVMIATPPGFRPYHYRAAVEKGLHVFMEKPIFIDAPGFRHVMQTNKMAEEKNLVVCVGFQRHAIPGYYNWVEQIHAGKIGDVQYSRVFWNQGNIWCRHRSAMEAELNFQIKNWYHFVWLCGDNIVEQHCHNIDVGNWVHGKGDRLTHPKSAQGQGGRTYKGAPNDLLRQAPPFANRAEWDTWYRANTENITRHGQAWDHFSVEFEYDDGSRMFSQCRHIPRAWNIVTEFIYGTRGWGQPARLQEPGLNGKEIWSNTEGKPQGKGEFQWEHNLHVKAIRDNKPMPAYCSDGYSAAMSCMAAVMGREAAYSGKVITWDELVEKGRSYFPEGEITSFDQIAPVQPDADGFYESTVPVPGVYNPFA